MKKATVIKPFITDRNEICLSGDIVYIEGSKVFFNRVFLGRFCDTNKEVEKKLLSVGIVLEDTKKKLGYTDIPKVHVVVPHKTIIGEPYALNLNKDLIELINTYHTYKGSKTDLAKEHSVQFRQLSEVSELIRDFLRINDFNGKISIAGKNYLGFDVKFLSKLHGWDLIGWSRRVIDPAVLFIDWTTDDELPDLTTCKKRADIEGVVTHNAVEDAYDVVSLLRKFY